MNFSAENGNKVSPDRETIQEQIHKITKSSGFVSSESLRSVLLYLFQHAMENPGQTVKEYEIATRVLGRSHNFDSRIDSTVRAVASRLRSKLAEYYVHDGACDPIVIDLPKGSYALSFSVREIAKPPNEQPVVTAEMPNPTVSPDSRIRILPFAAIFVIGIALVGSIAYTVGRRSAFTPIPASTKLFWGDFLKSGDPLIIFPNPSFRGLPQSGMKLVMPDGQRTEDTIDVFTGTGEATALAVLTRQIIQVGHDSRAKRAHLFTWDDATHSNLIFIGGQVQNPAFAQLPKLQRFNLKSPDEEPFLHQGGVHDESPKSGEPAYYLASQDFNNGNDYAIIALTEGVSPQYRILILAGSNTYGTEGAANFLCDPDLLKKLIEKLGVHAGSPVPFFEAVVRVPERGGAPISPELVQVYKRHP